jgi:hypothetical protein
MSKPIRIGDLDDATRAALQRAVDQYGMWWNGEMVVRPLVDDDVVTLAYCEPER